MGLPFSRNQTYTAGVTEVASADMNGLQDGVANLWTALLDTGFIFNDDFTGSAVDTGKWATVSGSPAIADDSANGGYGALHVNAASVQVSTQYLPVGTNDFIFATRFRMATSPTGITHRIGLVNSLANGFYLQMSGGTVWNIYADNGPSPTPLSLSNTNTTYHTARLVRQAGTITLYIDGAPAWSQSDAFDVGACQLYISASTSGPTPNLYVDYMKLWLPH